jgi:hypothetical protein
MADVGEGDVVGLASAAEDEGDAAEVLGDAVVSGEVASELQPATAARMAALQATARNFFMGIRIDEGSGPAIQSRRAEECLLAA